MNSVEALKAFCKNEGFHFHKMEKDTNNGRLVTLQVGLHPKHSKVFFKNIIFQKSKWSMPDVASKERMFQILAADFFSELGVTTVDGGYWGLEREADQEERGLVRPPRKPRAKNIDNQIDKILSEEGSDEAPGVVEALSGLTDGIADKSPAGLFDALATEGGLEQVGKILQNPNMTKMISPMMAMMGGMGMPNIADMMKTAGGAGMPFPKMVPKAVPPTAGTDAGETAEEVPLVHTPETPEVVEADE